MPKIKTKREDVLRNNEVDEMLQKLSGKDVIRGEYETTLHDKPITQTFNIPCRMTECLIALLWLFGKRIREVLKLKRKDVWARGNSLYVRFHVLKKKSREDEAIPKRYLKRITLENPYTKYVLGYVKAIKDPETYLFHGRSKDRVRKVKMKKKVYVYHLKNEGMMSPEKAWKIIKFLNPKAWCHLFRHSIATQMAEEGATEDELMDWFDWSRSDTAHDYVKRGPRLIEKWANRRW